MWRNYVVVARALRAQKLIFFFFLIKELEISSLKATLGFGELIFCCSPDVLACWPSLVLGLFSSAEGRFCWCVVEMAPSGLWQENAVPSRMFLTSAL